MEKEKIKLTQELWAKILAFVLLGIFLAVLAAGIFAAMMQYNELPSYKSADDFTSSLEYMYGYDELNSADKVYAQNLMRLIYTVSGWWLCAVLVGAAGAIACLVFLFMGAGHRKGKESARLNLLDKIPLDLYAAGCFALAFVWLLLFVELTEGMAYFFALSPEGITYLAFTCIVVYTAGLVALAPFLSFATRVKSGGGIWWRNTVIYMALRLCLRVLRWCWDKIKAFCRGVWYMTTKIPIVWRTALIVAAVLLINILLAMFAWDTDSALILWILFMALVFLLACFGAWQMKSLKAAGEKLAAGEFEYKIDTKHMYWEFKHHAENLNSIGDGMAAAVEQRMKSERLKTELITNVSHDIKTPLTSIINYVDLLERPHTPEEGAEYLEVLERQSKRLKKLTEDLVEASKASTGNMSVTLAPTSTLEIINQSLAEYGQRMEAGKLSVLINVPEPAPAVRADGRLLWRVMDNLFNNVVKYAMPETRVYVDVRMSEGNAVISVKNISRAALNVSAGELMERFVRGDASRSTEGSGLGLSIAKSLTELQHGQFSISTDGDLFKAEITLPLA
ncbi:MAG TPA: HAMP domain-containing histidine kinase [Candidatus Scatomorpha stercorigallinarum]|nr:HAMP domain-containing histidine kinase [Candidatus Scatomorpha stercorigallinarum]